MWFIGVEVEQETSAPPPKKILDPPLGNVTWWKSGCCWRYSRWWRKSRCWRESRCRRCGCWIRRHWKYWKRIKNAINKQWNYCYNIIAESSSCPFCLRLDVESNKKSDTKRSSKRRITNVVERLGIRFRPNLSVNNRNFDWLDICSPPRIAWVSGLPKGLGERRFPLFPRNVWYSGYPSYCIKYRPGIDILIVRWWQTVKVSAYLLM